MVWLNLLIRASRIICLVRFAFPFLHLVLTFNPPKEKLLHNFGLPNPYQFIDFAKYYTGLLYLNSLKISLVTLTRIFPFEYFLMKPNQRT